MYVDDVHSAQSQLQGKKVGEEAAEVVTACEDTLSLPPEAPFSSIPSPVLPFLPASLLPSHYLSHSHLPLLFSAIPLPFLRRRPSKRVWRSTVSSPAGSVAEQQPKLHILALII